MFHVYQAFAGHKYILTEVFFNYESSYMQNLVWSITNALFAF